MTLPISSHTRLVDSMDPPTLPSPLLHHFLQLARSSSSSSRLILGIAGQPGSGKTTLASSLCSALCAELGPGSAAALSMDGFHLPRSTLAQGIGGHSPQEAFERRGCPWTFDPAGLAQALAAVRAGRDSNSSVAWPGFDHSVGDPEHGAVSVPPSAVLVLVEGLYLLHRADGWEALEGLLDAVYYLDTPPELAAQRLCKRHMSAWGISEEEALARIARNDGQNAQLVAGTRGAASALLAPE